MTLCPPNHAAFSSRRLRLVPRTSVAFTALTANFPSSVNTDNNPPNFTGDAEMSKAAACSTAFANSVYLIVFFLQASSAESSHGTVSPIKYSICCVSDHSTKCALRLFPTGLSTVYSSLFSSLWLTHSWTAVAGQNRLTPIFLPSMTKCQQVYWPLNTQTLHPERIYFSVVKAERQSATLMYLLHALASASTFLVIHQSILL